MRETYRQFSIDSLRLRETALRLLLEETGNVLSISFQRFEDCAAARADRRERERELLSKHKLLYLSLFSPFLLLAVHILDR